MPEPASRIRPKYWIECNYCGHEEIISEHDPETNKTPINKAGAWRAAGKSGYKGSSKHPKCPNCVTADKSLKSQKR